ncbi:MAG: hypothetical protein GY938_18535, partial [Ketobacter sp.]|nr:hypothetical protein [Ketobacter sp.]
MCEVTNDIHFLLSSFTVASVIAIVVSQSMILSQQLFGNLSIFCRITIANTESIDRCCSFVNWIRIMFIPSMKPINDPNNILQYQI